MPPPNWHPLIASRVFNTPLLIHPAKYDAIVGALGREWGIDVPQPTPAAYSALPGEYRRPGYRVVEGVAVIEIFGVLAHRGGLDADSTYILGYQQIARQIDTAVADPDVHAIVLDIDSPGGEVAGAFELADQILAIRDQKPIHAIADSVAASAAYLIASATSGISVSRTGYTGSIGVVWRHADLSRALDKKGISITYIHAGTRKIDGNPTQPLPDDVRADFQAEVDALYGMFVETVAINRGISEEAVRGTQARVYLGEAGVQTGLADCVETADELIHRLAHSSTTTSLPTGGTMTQTTNQPAAGAGQTIDRQLHETALASAREEGKQEGIKAERERIQAILGSDAATGREALAHHMAFETDMDSGACIAMLEKTPKAAAEKPTGLIAAMANTPQPNIAPDTPEAELGAFEERSLLATEIAAGAR